MRQYWDNVVRTTHWLVAVGFLVNRFEFTSPGSDWHRAFGIAIAALVVLRLLWGVTGARGPARLSALIPSVAGVREHVHEVRDRTAHQVLGHNPFGAIAIWLFWIGLLLIAATGVAQDSFLSSEWPIYEWHGLLVDFVTGLVVVHILAVIGLSLWLKRNLLAAMLPGRGR